MSDYNERFDQAAAELFTLCDEMGKETLHVFAYEADDTSPTAAVIATTSPELAARLKQVIEEYEGA